MDGIDIVFRLAGAFYLIAGWLGIRAILLDSVLDKALAAISAGTPEPVEEWRRRLLGALTILVGASGAALLFMNFWALPLFLLVTASQAVWFAGLRGLFIKPEEDDDRSRRQVANAAILYAVATLGVVWLWRAGRLQPWDEPFGAAATALAAAGLALWFVYHMAWKAPSPGEPFVAEVEDTQPAPQRIAIAPEFGWNPLVDADTGRRFSHYYWFEETFARRIEAWDAAFQAAFDPGDVPPQGPSFASPAEEAAWRDEGLALARELEERYGADNVTFAEGWDDCPRGTAA